MSWNKIAQEFKKRDNADIENVLIGTVTSINPLAISVLNGQIILTDNNCIVSQEFAIFNVVGLDSINGSIEATLDRSLKVNDIVLCFPIDQTGNKYFITR